MTGVAAQLYGSMDGAQLMILFFRDVCGDPIRILEIRNQYVAGSS